MRRGVYLLVGSLIGCSTVPSAPGGGGGDAPPGVTDTPSPRILKLDFEKDALGNMPKDWVGVRAEMIAQGKKVPDWLFDGTWEVASINVPPLQGKVLRQTQKAREPWISLVRYRGSHFGPNGQLPLRYRFEVKQQPIDSPYNLPPTGDQGVQPYYLDADHYLEVVNTPRDLQVWYCDGGQPMNGRGWKRLYSRSLSTRPGDVRRVGGTVDVTRKTFVLTYDGKPEATLQVPEIDPLRTHSMALRSIGNMVNFDDVEVSKLD